MNILRPWLIKRHRGAVLVWVLPTLGVLAMAAVWWLSSSGPTPEQALPPDPSAANSVSEKPAPVVERQIQAPTSGQTHRATAETRDPKPTPKPHVLNVSEVAPGEAPVVPSSSEKRADPTQSQNKDAAKEAVAKELEGDWAGYFQGQREMTVEADGTGTMVSYPEGLAATFLAAKLSFNFRWTLNGDQLEFETLGGEPADKVKIVVQMYGRRRSHRILKRQKEEMILLDEDGVTQYVWKRAPKKKPAPAAATTK